MLQKGVNESNAGRGSIQSSVLVGGTNKEHNLEAASEYVSRKGARIQSQLRRNN